MNIDTEKQYSSLTQAKEEGLKPLLDQLNDGHTYDLDGLAGEALVVHYVDGQEVWQINSVALELSNDQIEAVLAQYRIVNGGRQATPGRQDISANAELAAFQRKVVVTVMGYAAAYGVPDVGEQVLVDLGLALFVE